MNFGKNDQGPAFFVSVLLFCASVLLGGATRAGFLSDVLLQFVSVPCLLLALWLWADRLGDAKLAGHLALRSPPAMIGLALGVIGGGIILAQFLPLFGSFSANRIWSEIARRGGDVSGEIGASGASSLSPDLGAAAVAAIIPALALFLLVARLDQDHRLRLIGWMVLAGLASLVIGVCQVLTGASSPLRFFSNTGVEAVGFFANRNHFAAQMYATLCLSVVWLTHRWAGRFAGPRFTAEKAQRLGTAISLALLVMGAIALARSRAGIILALLAFIPLIMLAPPIISRLTSRRSALGSGRMRATLVVGAFLLVIAALGADRVMPRFEASVLADLRGRLATITAGIALNVLPSGTGLGTFIPAYQAFEPDDALLPQMVNRAHNDWVELVIEAGLPGTVLILLFVAWFGLHATRAWIGGGPDSPFMERLVPQVASLIILLLMLHSLVDYPLRTGAMLAYFAACCAFLVPPFQSKQPAGRPNQHRQALAVNSP